MDVFPDIWNEAYNILAEDGEQPMWEYLRERVASGDMHEAMTEIGNDIIETYNL